MDRLKKIFDKSTLSLISDILCVTTSSLDITISLWNLSLKARLISSSSSLRGSKSFPMNKSEILEKFFNNLEFGKITKKTKINRTVYKFLFYKT